MCQKLMRSGKNKKKTQVFLKILAVKLANNLEHKMDSIQR